MSELVTKDAVAEMLKLHVEAGVWASQPWQVFCALRDMPRDECEIAALRLEAADLREKDRVRDAAIKTAIEADTSASEVKLSWYTHNAGTDMAAGTLSTYWSATVHGLVKRVAQLEAELAQRRADTA